jgi:hypothetical protein
MLQHIPQWANKDKIAIVYAKRGPGQVVDHVVPLKGVNAAGEHVVCGLHVHNNLRVVSRRTDALKGQRWEASK